MNMFICNEAIILIWTIMLQKAPGCGILVSIEGTNLNHIVYACMLVCVFVCVCVCVHVAYMHTTTVEICVHTCNKSLHVKYITAKLLLNSHIDEHINECV